jgi:Subtilase family/FlgD Ig-like domain
MKSRSLWISISLVLSALPLVAPVSGAATIHVDPHAAFTGRAPRAPQVLSEAALARLRSEGRSVLWVHFADKGIFDEGAFRAALDRSARQILDPARRRRAKETGGRLVPDYYDLPVVTSYVDAVARTGARVRHVSKWLNAMTVEADESEARAIAGLPYVRLVTPARRSRRIEPVSTAPLPPGSSPQGTAPQGGGPQGAGPVPPGAEWASPTLPKPTAYGASTTPLTGINAIAAHDSGWSAATVVVAMFDTGFDKNHQALSSLLRVAERDFVFGDSETANQAQDVTGQWDHGTGTWSVLGGYYPANLVGPAYNARFLLAKTEDIRSEAPVEEDNWVAAAEWADSLGAEVISSSLAYFDFDGTANDYTYSDLDGYTTVIARGAILAARRGIVLANAMGNTGPGTGTLWSPADTESILACGAVDSGDFIAGFSSRGPTADGRTKPEVVAQGVSTPWAVAGTVNTVGTASGTSLSTPLVGGAVALVREAHPEWTVVQVRQALMTTADKAATPDNNYGWGRINVVSAIYNSTLGGPVAPKPFNLLVPINNASVTQVPVTFKWRRTTDPQAGALTYRLSLYAISPQPCCLYEVTTTESSLVYNGYLGPSRTYEWLVTAIDPQGHERLSKDFFRFTTGATTDVPTPAAPPSAPQVTLRQNRPNPARSLTEVDFLLAGQSGVVPVTLRIFDAQGRLVRTLLDHVNETVPAQCTARWDGTDEKGRRATSGIYYYRLEVAEETFSKRLVLVR